MNDYSYNYGGAITLPYKPNQNFTPTNSNTNIIWIQGGIATAKSWYVAPNSTVALWDADNHGIIYWKSVDAFGMPSIKILRYTEENDEPQKVEQPLYVTQAEFNEVLCSIKDLRDELDGLSIKRPKKKEVDG